jgi:DNA-binding CsgD family transcriptional regulator
VWPVAVALGLVTVSVLTFPDGRLPSRRWRLVVVVVAVMTGLCAATSALWPVEYDASGLTTTHPLHASSPAAVADAWSLFAHPLYAGLEIVWVVAVVVRWRLADGHIRSQLLWLGAAAGLSAGVLAVGLLVWRSPAPGLLAASLIPIAAGWAVVHGEHLAAYSALTWLSRRPAGAGDLSGDLARAAARAVSASGATLWTGGPSVLHAVGVYPETFADIAPSDLHSLRQEPGLHVRAVSMGGETIGALTVRRANNERLSLAQERLLDDLAAQAALVLDRQTLADVIDSQRRAGHLDGLSPREREVLDLMARGMSNAAICAELHLSVKTVEPVVSAIFAKLQLHPDVSSNRRVLAVLAYLRS